MACAQPPTEETPVSPIKNLTDRFVSATIEPAIQDDINLGKSTLLPLAAKMSTNEKNGSKVCIRYIEGQVDPFSLEPIPMLKIDGKARMVDKIHNAFSTASKTYQPLQGYPIAMLNTTQERDHPVTITHLNTPKDFSFQLLHCRPLYDKLQYLLAQFDIRKTIQNPSTNMAVVVDEENGNLKRGVIVVIHKHQYTIEFVDEGNCLQVDKRKVFEGPPIISTLYNIPALAYKGSAVNIEPYQNPEAGFRDFSIEVLKRMKRCELKIHSSSQQLDTYSVSFVGPTCEIYIKALVNAKMIERVRPPQLPYLPNQEAWKVFMEIKVATKPEKRTPMRRQITTSRPSMQNEDSSPEEADPLPFRH